MTPYHLDVYMFSKEGQYSFLLVVLLVESNTQYHTVKEFQMSGIKIESKGENMEVYGRIKIEIKLVCRNRYVQNYIVYSMQYLYNSDTSLFLFLFFSFTFSLFFSLIFLFLFFTFLLFLFFSFSLFDSLEVTRS